MLQILSALFVSHLYNGGWRTCSFSAAAAIYENRLWADQCVCRQKAEIMQHCTFTPHNIARIDYIIHVASSIPCQPQRCLHLSLLQSDGGSRKSWKFNFWGFVNRLFKITAWCRCFKALFDGKTVTALHMFSRHISLFNFLIHLGRNLRYSNTLRIFLSHRSNDKKSSQQDFSTLLLFLIVKWG